MSGACFPCPLSQTGAPSLPQHYPRSSLLWAPPTPGHRCLLPRCSGLSEGAQASACANGRASLVTVHSQSQARRGYPIPGGFQRLAYAPMKLLPAGVLKPSALSNAVFSGLDHLQGRHYPLPLHLACFRAYASSATLPQHLQGSIPGPWLAATRAGLSPARIHGIAKPQPRPDPALCTGLARLYAQDPVE